ncbi:DUF4160 domain-containing protein [Methylobacterium sp. J-048]|uniref:DUF4160 domain-containing protein n=1 Tax=Methylobacterium sp. J-048 TaxID=2836635 RepID=UPI001FBB664D|nr:DUF4160 domain-containing protein [Methylobacterium sp. J-048]MCJ2059837.1 DUF4160 domain-containing protein [Methylobacterium sp. J-048]
MPKTSVELPGLRVSFYSNDHEPRHVHVTDGANVAVFVLNCPDGPPTLRENHGFALHRVNRIRKALAEVIPTLCDDWEAHFGAPDQDD